MNLIARAIEWMWPGLREWRIEAEMEDGGEDAISARDAAWMEELAGETTGSSTPRTPQGELPLFREI